MGHSATPSIICEAVEGLTSLIDRNRVVLGPEIHVVLIHERRVGQHVVDGELQWQKDRLWYMHLWIVFRKVDPVVAYHDTDEHSADHKACHKNTLTVVSVRFSITSPGSKSLQLVLMVFF